MDRRPPLALSPRRLRPRPHRAPRPPLVPPPAAAVKKTPPGSVKMRASVCAIPSPVRQQPSPMRASVSALSSPVCLDLMSPLLRASISALPPAPRLDLSPPRRAKLDLHAAPSPTRARVTAAPSPARAATAAGKENVPTAASPHARPVGKKEDMYAAAVRDAEEEMWLDLAAIAAESPPRFVRGRNYVRYAALRDERLRCKHGFPYGDEWASPEAVAEDPCVAVELSKLRVARKGGTDSVRRSVPATGFGAVRTSAMVTRSSLRSSKEMKKASAASGLGSVAVKNRRINSRSSVRRI